jgi:hypothetical protein
MTYDEMTDSEALQAAAENLGKIATWIKYLGAGQNGSEMGAVEFHAIKTKEGLDSVAEAIGRLADAVADVADALTPGGGRP